MIVHLASQQFKPETWKVTEICRMNKLVRVLTKMLYGHQNQF